jgi:hypothetical protein
MTTVVNRKQTQAYDVYIGRPTLFGNPFRVGTDGTRDEVIAKFRTWFHAPERAELRGEDRGGPMILEQVISGGQTGVDQVALHVAKELGYQTGGMAPLHYRTDAGPAPELLRDVYGLTMCTFAGYRLRTRYNVRIADATIWFGEYDSPGKRCTLRAVEEYGKPYLCHPTAEVLRHWLDAFEIRILNVAGHRLRTHPDAAAYAASCLALALRRA